MTFETSPRRELRFAGAANVRGLRPMRGRLLVRIEPPVPVSESLIMPGGSQSQERRIRQGTVVARGGDDGHLASAVRVGDVVLFPAGCAQGLRLRLNGQEHLLVREQDVLAIMQEP